MAPVENIEHPIGEDQRARIRATAHGGDALVTAQYFRLEARRHEQLRGYRWGGLADFLAVVIQILHRIERRIEKQRQIMQNA